MMAPVRTTAVVGMPIVVVAIACLGIAGCSGSAATPSAKTAGESQAPAGSASLMPSGSTPSTAASASQQESTMPFRLTSTAFEDEGAIPRKFSCDGDNVSPALEWDGAPDATRALALIVDDTDAGGFVHWVVFNMTGTRSGALAEAVSASPDAPSQGKNSFGKVGWGGPCPPSGTHHYRFTLYALDGPLGLTGTPRADDVRQAASGHVLGETKLTGTYRRGG
jgi:Raf kinase inhibitor-like YbhB/YbcL family protein